MLCFTLVVIAIADYSVLFSQHTHESDGDFEAPLVFERAADKVRESVLRELQAVQILGTQQTTFEELAGVIQAVPSDLSLTRRITRYYHTNLKRNKFTPVPIMRTLDSMMRDLASELRYYDPRVADADSVELLRYLNQNGFHRASVRYMFGFDRTSRLWTLSYLIREGPRSLIDTLVYVGLDSLPADVDALVRIQRTIRPGTPFSEAAIERETRGVTTVLRNNGFMNARSEVPWVFTAPEGIRDTVVVVFHPGKRYRIGYIDFVENSNNQPSVLESARERQLEFRTSQWYSSDMVQQTRMNLYSLGTFETVTIDTISVGDSLATSKFSRTDTTIPIRIFTKNAKVHDVGADLLIYQTAIDNFLNLGVGASALHRNTLGSAQSATLSLQYILQDVSRLFQGQVLQSEIIGRLRFNWPNISRIAASRVSLNSEAYYSLRSLFNTFRLEAFGITAIAPIALKRHTLFNGFDLSLSVERQVPLDFRDALDEALKDASTPEERANIVQTFNTFKVLDDYLSSGRGFFTGYFAGFSLRGEHRDNPVNPTKGYFSNLSAEVGGGAGSFMRTQLMTSALHPVGTRLIFASKLRLGHIFIFDPANIYVPVERQFFSGGAASIRSYASRRLHDPNSGRLTDTLHQLGDLFDNILGSRSLIELGFELRYTFQRPRELDDLWASLIERSGFTLFSDIGNAFNRLTPDLYRRASLNDFVVGNIIAAGIGYRFDTPVGPFRVDYATSIYDPNRANGVWITKRDRPFAFSNWMLSIGLGHAF